MLHRLWTSVVGGVAGAALGLVTAILLLQYGKPLDAALDVVWVFAGAGVLICFVNGGRKAA